MRQDRDSLGVVSIDDNALWGAQTQRAIANFRVSGIPIGHLPALVHALAKVKLAAARVNVAQGRLSREKAEPIVRASEEVIAGHHADQFPVDVLQGGAGTSSNMNMNEVLANRALQLLGYARGRHDIIHPNDHVNLCQSTNDVYPTAIRIALITQTAELRSALITLADEFSAKGTEFAGIEKLGRTQLQDAVPMTLGQEFTAFGNTLREDVLRLDEIPRLFAEVNLGGTAIGTGLLAPDTYRTAVIAELAGITGLPLVSSADLIESSWDTGAFVLFSGMLKRTATKLSKIANDLRLLSSGPRGGLGEIALPPMQPGSSIMPGKVNPVIPEMVNQIAFQVIGADITVTLAAEAGQLQLNAFEPVIVYNLMTALALLSGGAAALAKFCVSGIRANPAACKAHLDRSTAHITALVPEIGYARAVELAKEMLSADGVPSTA
ncbi:aspartate ammonia-lyase [Mesorhizobium sp. VK23B]|uniref:Aspartate ammonia-lyase n=1 Tax=Mesorhizobium dulcispinae TaxID=3072316 RepID=A0ABU4XBA7_9HYPH|nr:MULTISPECIES: aspartate ammonia-lyase [unclassified Mesorhizobium]MDX8465727.1 aspartate ammonia-lyase [Mesorhizobium sp. VK23B]MDX8471471.1 aspartate ammonia-lyase [Mesorhizobium sp. VK23A]